MLAHGRFVGGPEITEFEAAFAAFCETTECIGVANGTEALTLALRAAGIGRDDEVVVPTFTFAATGEAVLLAGARPVFVDVDPSTALVDVDAVAAAVGERTSAIVVVHLYGQPVDLAAFRALADRRGLLLVEDAAQAHGARWRGVAAGSVGDVATFSFFPGKNLGAIGDAGAVATSDEELAAKVRLLRDHGRSAKYVHEIVGTNARLDTLQAAVLLAKLPYVHEWNDARRAHAAAYDAAFADAEGVDPVRVAPDAEPVYHQYVVRVRERDDALEALARRGVAAGVHYPIPLHRQPAFAEVAGRVACPSADALADDVLSIPVYPELIAEARTTVAEALVEHASR